MEIGKQTYMRVSKIVYDEACDDLHYLLTDASGAEALAQSSEFNFVK